MGKDLRTSTVQLKLHKYPKLDGNIWGFKTLQPYFPPLEKLFKTETLSNLQDYGIKLSNEIDAIIDEAQIRVGKSIVPVHRKTTMILSSYKWMRGDYSNLSLPKPSGIADEMNERLQSHHTAGYVGALASIVLSESGCQHFPKVYGVFTGVKESHTIDISDDYEDLTTRHWFSNNLGKTFDLKMKSNENDAEFTHTRRQRNAIALGEDIELDGIEDIAADHISNPESASATSETQDSESESYVDDETSDTEDDNVFEIESCDCSTDSEDSDNEDYEEDEPFAWATFSNVPVVTTVMELCEGTLYDLLKTYPEPTKHVSWFAQIVFALAYAQRNFGFTHNDLHGNNVMYVKTDQEFLYYNHGGMCYKIPTHGYLIKIIDFDRAAFSVKLQGMKESRFFMSNHFHSDEEAGGQYNISPFHIPNYPVILPSPSFDLVRLATSMFWDMFPEGPDHEYTHPLFSLFKQWMLQSDGTSVMFREQKDNHDRYHGFHLYKAIARWCRDSAVPKKEISKLTSFIVPVVPLGTYCLHIEI